MMATFSTHTVRMETTAVPALRRALTSAWRFNRTLTLAVVINTLLIPVTILLAVFDPVTITGVNGWLKPLKFSISIAVYGATLLWFLTYVPRRKVWVNLIATTVGAFLLLENVLIIVQVVRRTTSHFNNATPFDAFVFSAMGTMIMIVALANLVVAIWLVLAKIEDRVLAAGLRWGIWITLAGMAVTALMVMPTAEQQAQIAEGIVPAVIGAHSVGVPDESPGLPLVGWSTTGGDLRVGHFVGLHALQIIPLLAWLLQRPRAAHRWSVGKRAMLVRLGGLLYLGVVGIVTWQATRGEPLIAPSGGVLAAFFCLLALVSIAAVVTIRRGESTTMQIPVGR